MSSRLAGGSLMQALVRTGMMRSFRVATAGPRTPQLAAIVFSCPTTWSTLPHTIPSRFHSALSHRRRPSPAAPWLSAPWLSAATTAAFSSSHVKKPAAAAATATVVVGSVTNDLRLKTIEGKELLQDELEKRRDQLRERRDDFVADMRAKKLRVRQRVRTKMDEMIVEHRENVLTIPNALTVGRAAMAPYLYYVVSVQADYTLAMGVLALAGLTDLLDGQIARNWPSQATKMGSFLDPMADKLLVGALAVSMCSNGLFPVWLCAMVLFRDVFLVGAGFVIRYISLPPPKTVSRYFDVTHATAQLEPTLISKVNTAVQLAAIAGSLGAPIWNYVDHAALHGLWYFTGATTVAAALSYIISKDTYKIIAKSRSNPLKP